MADKEAFLSDFEHVDGCCSSASPLHGYTKTKQMFIIVRLF